MIHIFLLVACTTAAVVRAHTCTQVKQNGCMPSAAAIAEFSDITSADVCCMCPFFIIFI